MTDKELRKLRRADLLEMLLNQSKETESLRHQLEEAQEKLKCRRIKLDEAGNIAEAALQLNGIFEAAQQAAGQYLENMEEFCKRQKEACARIEKESQEKADRLLEQTKERCERMEQECKKRCMEMEEKARTVT